MKKLKNLKFFLGTVIVMTFFSNNVIAQPDWLPNSNTINGSYGTALGANHTIDIGSNAFAAGVNNLTRGYTAVCFGENSEATANYSMAFGTYCISDSYYSYSKGYKSEARNDFAMAYGKNVIATGHTAFVIGSCIEYIGELPPGGIQLTNPIDNSLMIGFNSTAPTVFVGPSNGVDEFGVGTVGKVGIGTILTPSTLNGGAVDISYYTLYVDGGMLADEVRVRTSWADYVFKDDYKLKPLFEVESFINTNGHLPNMPSAKEVAAGGIELGDMTRIQQEKIEELTLYIINQQKQIDELKIEMDALKAK